MMADINSFRETSYMMNNKKQLLFFSDLNFNGKPILYNPRCLLKKSIEDFKKLNIDINPQFQSEINFCIYEGNYKNNENNLDNLIPITEHSNLFNTLYKNKFEDFFKKVKNALKTSNIGYEGIKGDEAEGQFRILISASDAVEFCDNIVLMKLVIISYNFIIL
jgi:glutamine synthetase